MVCNFAATSEGNQCYCMYANDGDFTTVGTCDSPCAGSDSDMCGGSVAMSVTAMDGAYLTDPGRQTEHRHGWMDGWMRGWTHA